jgi:hypothetical protein
VVVAWIGALAPGAVARPEFKTIEREPDVSDPWNGRRPQASPRDEQALDLEELVCLAEETGSLAPGETRLVGWHLDEMPGERIEPAGARRRRATLVVARLAMADADARPDVWEPNAKDPFNSRRVLEFDLPAQLPEAEQPAAGP